MCVYFRIHNLRAVPQFHVSVKCQHIMNTKLIDHVCATKFKEYIELLTVVACTSENLVIQVQHKFSFKKIG